MRKFYSDPKSIDLIKTLYFERNQWIKDREKKIYERESDSIVKEINNSCNKAFEFKTIEHFKTCNSLDLNREQESTNSFEREEFTKLDLHERYQKIKRKILGNVIDSIKSKDFLKKLINHNNNLNKKLYHTKSKEQKIDRKETSPAPPAANRNENKEIEKKHIIFKKIEKILNPNILTCGEKMKEYKNFNLIGKYLINKKEKNISRNNKSETFCCSQDINLSLLVQKKVVSKNKSNC